MSAEKNSSGMFTVLFFIDVIFFVNILKETVFDMHCKVSPYVSNRFEIICLRCCKCGALQL